MPEAFDRRNANRDAAGWVRAELEKITRMIGDTRMDIVVGHQQLDGKIGHLEEKIAHLNTTLIQSIPNGDPEKHLHHHIRLEVKEQEELDELAETKKFRKDVIYKGKMGLLILLLGMLSLGFVDYARNFVLGVEQGKTSMELQKNEPVQQRGHSEGKERFNR